MYNPFRKKKKPVRKNEEQSQKDPLSVEDLLVDGSKKATITSDGRLLSKKDAIKGKEEHIYSQPDFVLRAFTYPKGSEQYIYNRNWIQSRTRPCVCSRERRNYPVPQAMLHSASGATTVCWPRRIYTQSP